MRGEGRGGRGGHRSRDDFHVEPRGQNYGRDEYQDPPQNRFYGEDYGDRGYNQPHYNDYR